jgi:hypothetical protein
MDDNGTTIAISNDVRLEVKAAAAAAGVTMYTFTNTALRYFINNAKIDVGVAARTTSEEVTHD